MLPGPPAKTLKLGKPGWRPRSTSAADLARYPSASKGKPSTRLEPRLELFQPQLGLLQFQLGLRNPGLFDGHLTLGFCDLRFGCDPSRLSCFELASLLVQHAFLYRIRFDQV